MSRSVGGVAAGAGSGGGVGGGGRWPAHGSERLAWVSRTRGPQDDRLLREYTAVVPPAVAQARYSPGADVLRRVDEATAALAAFSGRSSGGLLEPVTDLLVRGESIASSRIEEVRARADQVAAASLGVRTPAGARQVVAAARAAQLLLAAADDHDLVLEDLLAAHRELMGDEADPRDQAGMLRTVQNWVGGSDYSPRGALHVPPAPHRIAACMDDLLRLAARRDLPALAQAALVHAQLESIHPFVDGNGRIGRALIHAVLRRRVKAGAAPVPVPVAAALAGRRQAYFAALDSYRKGDADRIVLLLADAVQRAVLASEHAAQRLEALPRQWRQVRDPRSGSAEAALLGTLLEHPVLDAETAQRVSGASASATYAALDSLLSVGILRLAVERRRDRVWVAAAVMDEVEVLLDELAVLPG